MNYKQAITTGKLLTYLILLLTGEIGDRGRKEKLKITVKRGEKKKRQALGTAYMLFMKMMEYDTDPTPKILSIAMATHI